jgi:hypothetical protein
MSAHHMYRHFGAPNPDRAYEEYFDRRRPGVSARVAGPLSARASTLRLVLTMTAALQEIPPDHRGGYELERDDLSAAAASYDEALERIREQLQPGWRILSLRVDR